MVARTKPEQTKARVFLVNDQLLVRRWLSQSIQREEYLTVCGEAEDTRQADSELFANYGLWKAEDFTPDLEKESKHDLSTGNRIFR